MAGRKPTVDDDRILFEILIHTDPFVVAADLTEPLDMGRNGVLKRLDKLAESDAGYVEKAEKPSVNIYWLTRAGRERAADYSRGNISGNQ